MSARELVILAGRAASGKSEYLFEQLKAHADRGESAILLTEEQSTYEAEKALCARYGGLLGTQVLSIQRFCQLVLEEAGTPLAYLSPQGRCMVLRKIAAAHKKELRLFSRAADKRGFAAEADQLINRLSKNAVTPESLSGTAAGLHEGALRDKLSDLSLLYRETELFLADKYLSEYSLLERAQACLGSSALAKSHIYVDSADLSGESAFRFLGALLDECLSMTVTVLMDPESSEPLFEPGRELYEKLSRLAADRGLSFREVVRQPREDGDPALCHLERNLYREKPEALQGAQSSLFLNACTGRREEVEGLCERIADLTEQGYHYKDIAVTLTDKESYLPLVRRAFRRRGIPIFEDAPRTLSSHAAADLVLSAVRFAANENMDDVLHIVKSGLTDVTREEAEQFENRVLLFRLYGSALFKPLPGNDVPPEAEAARVKLAGPLTALKEELSGPDKSAKARVEAIYRYLVALNVSQKLRENAAALQKEGENGEAQLLSEVWARLMEVLHQIYTILGSDPVTLKDLPGLLEEGIFATKLSPLPGNQDRVAVGDIDRSRNPQRDVLFVLGANEGLLPPGRTDDGIFSNAELNELAGCGLDLWEDTEKEMARDRLSIYTVLTKAHERLYITYALNGDNEALTPSVLKDKLEEMFPALKDAPLLTVPYPTYPAGAFEQTLRDSRELDKGKEYLERKAYFSGTEPYAAAFDKLSALSGMRRRTMKLGRRLAGQVYGRIRGVSASRLETFNKCPFEHFMRYGMRAEERKELSERASDSGTFLHDVLEAFLKRAQELDPEFTSVTEEQACAIIDEIIPEYIREHNAGIYTKDPILNAELFLQTEKAKRCAAAILRQIQSGDFLPFREEYKFGPDEETPALPIPVSDGETLYLKGRIDRIDRSRDGRFVRIIDYKLSSQKKFRPAELESGVTLQLPLYLEAARGLGQQIAGMYYMPLNLSPSKEDEEKRILLRGVTNGTEEVIDATEHDMDKKSTIIDSLGRSKSGFSGSVCEAEGFEELLGYAIKKAGETGVHIREGEIGIDPFKESCTYCPYASVCRYTPQSAGYKYRAQKKKRKLDDLIEDIREGRV